MDRQEAKLFKNTIIYGIGNLGSKILAYLMVLVYSYFIHSDELGYYDLIITTVSMIQPLIILGINEATYRFMVDSDAYGRGKVVSTSFRYILFSSAIATLVFIFIGNLFDIRLWQWILMYQISTIVFICLQEAIRGYTITKLYASLGIINGLITLILEFLGLVCFQKGVEVLIISKVIANIICVFIGIKKTRLFQDFYSNSFDKKLFRDLLKYSLPLVPNIICWWVMDFSDRYLIRAFLGVSANGIYAIANKFPTILATLTSIFYLAWQESAIREYSSENRDSFFSHIFNKYFKMLFSLCAFLIPTTKVVVTLFIADEYKSAWIYSLPLFIASAFGALCVFQGIGYQISKETLKSLQTTLIAATINIMVNLLFIRLIGLHAASVSTLIAYFLLYIIRIFHSKRYYVISYNWKDEILLVALCACSCISTIIIHNNVLLSIICVITFAIALWLNKQLFPSILNRKMV